MPKRRRRIDASNDEEGLIEERAEISPEYATATANIYYDNFDVAGIQEDGMPEEEHSNPMYYYIGEEDTYGANPPVRRDRVRSVNSAVDDDVVVDEEVASPIDAQPLAAPRELSPARVADAGLRKKLNDLARAIMDIKGNITAADIDGLVKSAFSAEELASLKPNLKLNDTAKLVVFVSAAKNGEGLVSNDHAAAVGFIKGARGEQNHIEWVPNPSDDPLKFLHQRLLLASTSDQVKAKDSNGISKVKAQLRQLGNGETFGLQKAYDDTNSDYSNPTWLGLGLDARFEEGIHRRYQELAAKPRRSDTTDPQEALEHLQEALENLSYNQFGAFIRKAIEHDAALLGRIKEDIKEVEEDIKEVERLWQQALLKKREIDAGIADGKFEANDATVQQYLSGIKDGKISLQKRYEGLLVKKQRAEMDGDKFADLTRKSDMELSALVGSAGKFEGNLDRGLDGMGRYSLLFLRMMEDNGDLLAAAIEVHKNGAFRVRLSRESNFAENLKEDRNLIFDLTEKEFACLVDAVENRSAVVIEAAEKGRQGRILVPLEEIFAARKRLVNSLDPQEEPEWWTHEKIKLFRTNKVILEGSDVVKKRTLLQAYIDLKSEEQSKEFKLDLAASDIDAEGQLEALISEYDRQIEKLKVVGEYKFKPLDLQITDADLNAQTPLTAANANLYSHDGNRTMYIEEMKGDKVISLDGGLVVQVYTGNEGFDRHSKQFEALSDVKFTGRPICSIARFDDRDHGDGNGTRNDYCIVTVTPQNTTKTFITEATFTKIAEQNAADFQRYAKHLTREKGLQEILDIMYVSLADLIADKKVDEAKSLAKEADELKKFLGAISFSDTDSVEEREKKIDRFNSFPKTKLERQTKELEKLRNEVFAKPIDPKEIARLNRWLAYNSVEGVTFEGGETAVQIDNAMAIVKVSLEQNKSTIFNFSATEIAKSGRERIVDIKDRMLSGNEISIEARTKAQAYASHATNDHLSKSANKQLLNNHFRIHLDSHQIEKMMDQYGSNDGHLWMKGTDKKDFERLLRAALPVSPVPGGVSIVKPRLGDKDFIRFADPSKNNSNGGPNFAQVTFAADADGNFTGDDRAFICLPGTNNIYIQVGVARIDGVMDLPGGKKADVKKGDVKIFEGYVFHRNKDGSYDAISTASTTVATSDLTKHFGKAKGADIREIAANFSVVASSVIGNEACAVAVSFNGKTCDSRKLVKARLSPYRDPDAPDRNISTVFEVDGEGRYVSDGSRHTKHQDYPKHKVIAHGMSEVRTFYGKDDAYHQMESNDTTPYITKPFKIALRVCVLEDAKGNQSFAKQLVIETFDAKGDPEYQPLDKAGLAKVTTDGFDHTAFISEMEALAKKADVVVGVKGPKGDEATSILESTDDRWFKAGIRTVANAVLRTAINLTVIGRVAEAVVGATLEIPRGEKHNSSDGLRVKEVRSDGVVKKVVNTALDVASVVIVLPAVVEGVASGVFGVQRPRFRDEVTLPQPTTGILAPATSAQNMGLIFMGKDQGKSSSI